MTVRTRPRSRRSFACCCCPETSRARFPSSARTCSTTKTPLTGAEDVFYWNKGEFGMKPTIRVNHITIYPVPHPRFPEALRYVVATSQIYANHYFSATLELRSIVD